MDKKIIQSIKHIATFYEEPPPGLIKEKEDEERPEDCIPDTAGNREAREFLANAPTKGLWMPLGKEVKVMQCWRCKQYGHRTGDKECPLFMSGNAESEKFRAAHEDPMYHILQGTKDEAQEQKLKWLQQLVNQSTSSSDDDDSSKKRKKKRKKRRKSSADEEEVWVEAESKKIKKENEISEDSTTKKNKKSSKKHKKNNKKHRTKKKSD